MIQDQEWPLVSIGMPVYNGENFIKLALDSLLNQTFTNFEILISDNASIDGTQKVCEEYARKDHRIRYVRQMSNAGPAKNYEYVLDHARGEYFMWAAHDDMWAPNWLEVLVPLLTPDLFAVRGSIRFLRDDQVISERMPRNYSRGSYAAFFVSEETIINCRHFYIYGLFNREALRGLDRKMLALDYCGDYLFVFQMLKNGGLKTVNQTHQFYRLEQNNLGTQMMRRYVGWRRLLYRVHPFEYYVQYIRIAPRSAKISIFIAVPIKHVYNQLRLWYRGFKKILCGVENI